jgi:hypothetical protein
MDENRGPGPIPKTIALVIITLLVTWLVQWIDARAVAKMDAMPPADFIELHRRALQHSYLFGFLALLVAGGFYLGLVEFISYLVRLAFPKA